MEKLVLFTFNSPSILSLTLALCYLAVLVNVDFKATRLSIPPRGQRIAFGDYCATNGCQSKVEGVEVAPYPKAMHLGPRPLVISVVNLFGGISFGCLSLGIPGPRMAGSAALPPL